MKVAFVLPFFGVRAASGAATECRHTAVRLAASGMEVDILTTCALDFQDDWDLNYHRQGTAFEDGLTVRRFRIEPVNGDAFSALNGRILNGETLSAREEKRFVAMHMNSFGLYRHLAAAGHAYDRVCFIPYLTGITYYGSMLCPGRAVLIPCLHEEGYAHMRLFAHLFKRVGKIVFHANAERELASRLYGVPAEKGVLLGEGIETEFDSDGDRFRRRHGVNGPFVLYVGRKAREKNVPTLIEYCGTYRARHADGPRLILAGPGALPIPASLKGAVRDLGLLSEQDKRDAYSAATVFCQPSLNESFSIVMMEAWLCGRPCLAHGDCAVTREHVTASGGGLYFRNYPEFEACLECLLSRPDLARRMGEAGRRYVRSRFAWDKIVARYRFEVFGLTPA